MPVTLELGGKSPQIVFADADLDAALPFLVNAGIQNAGQTCSASSRILVEAGILDEVVDRMARRYRALRAGPALRDLDLGPLVSDRQRATVLAYLAQGSSLEEIARGTIDGIPREAAITSNPYCSPATMHSMSWPRKRFSARYNS